MCATLNITAAQKQHCPRVPTLNAKGHTKQRCSCAAQSFLTQRSHGATLPVCSTLNATPAKRRLRLGVLVAVVDAVALLGGRLWLSGRSGLISWRRVRCPGPAVVLPSVVFLTSSAAAVVVVLLTGVAGLGRCRRVGGVVVVVVVAVAVAVLLVAAVGAGGVRLRRGVGLRRGLLRCFGCCLLGVGPRICLLLLLLATQRSEVLWLHTS